MLASVRPWKAAPSFSQQCRSGDLLCYCKCLAHGRHRQIAPVFSPSTIATECQLQERLLLESFISEQGGKALHCFLTLGNIHDSQQGDRLNRKSTCPLCGPSNTGEVDRRVRTLGLFAQREAQAYLHVRTHTRWQPGLVPRDTHRVQATAGQGELGKGALPCTF